MHKIPETNLVPPSSRGPIYTMGNQHAACEQVLNSHEGAVVSAAVEIEGLERVYTVWPGLEEPLHTERREGDSPEIVARRHIAALRDAAKKSPIQPS